MGGAKVRGWSRFVALVTCALLLVPVLVDLLLSPRYRPFGYAAGDTFYYLGVARTAIEQHSLSTDGVHSTNGFHPLWQLATIVVYGVCHALGQVDAALLATIIASLSCGIAAIWFSAQAFQLACGRVPTAFVVLPTGVYALIASYYWRIGPPNADGGLEGPLPVYGTLYSFVNGMESALTLLAFALLARTFLRREGESSLASGLKCGGACAFLCLARLDHAAFVLTPLLLWAVELFQARPRYRFVLGALTAAVLPIALYCVINWVYAGAALPISGTQKSRFPMPYLDQVGYAVQLLKAPLTSMTPLLIYRILPMVLCPLWAIAYVAIVTRVRVGESALSWSMRSFATRLDVFLVKMAPGIVLLAVYDLLYVFGVGHWYFPVSSLYLTLTSVSLASAVARRMKLPRHVRAVALAALSALGLLLFQRFHYKPDYHRKFAQFYWETAPRVREKLAGNVPKLVEMDDGIIAYALHVPSVSGIGYLLDAEAMRAQRAQRLFDVAYHRGFSAVSTFYYSDHGHLEKGGPEVARNWAQRLLGEDLSAYAATVLYDDATFSLVQLKKRGS
jgi:hypothetical protein